MVNLQSIVPLHRPKEQAQFVCKYCHRTFVREHAYLQHECKQMKREREFKSPVGQTAWHYYQLWMRNLKRSPPNGPAFMTSKYFRTFVNFVKFIKSVDLPYPEKFIWYMVEKKYTPTMWMSDDVYAEYIEFMDRKVSPIDQAKLTIETLLNVADRHEVDVSDVFSVIDPNDMIHWLRVRKMSPWLLLLSKKFRAFFVNDTSTEQQMLIESLVRPSYWANQFEKQPEAIAQIKRLIAALEI